MNFDLPGLATGTGVGGVLVAVAVFFLIRPTIRKIRSEANKNNLDGVAVIASTATAMVEPLTRRLKEVETNLESVSAELTEVKRDLAAAHLLVDDLTGKLDEANTRAAYFEDQWCIATGRPLPKRNPPESKGN